MKSPRSSVDNRRLEILKRIQDNDEVKVEDLAREFGLSLMTVRRDLQHLEERQLITRFYGGATARIAPVPMTEEEEIEMYRRCISQYAARFVNPGETLFINGSRVALGILEYVQAPNVQVYTNNGKAVSQNFSSNVSVTLTGGALREHIMVGDWVMRNLLSLTADKTFIGCAAITDKGEFCYNIPMEIGINEAMIARTTKELYILADHTKLVPNGQQEQRYGSCTYEMPWTLVTDEKADPEIVQKLRNLGKRVFVVGMQDIIA